MQRRCMATKDDKAADKEPEETGEEKDQSEEEDATLSQEDIEKIKALIQEQD